jgi:hypothetical protein
LSGIRSASSYARAIIVAQVAGNHDKTFSSKSTAIPFGSGKISEMSPNDLPTEEQFADDLTKVARNGIGRALPRKQGGKAIPYLWAAALELAGDQAEDLPALIAKVVVPAVRLVGPRGDQEAVAEILWIDLEAADGYRHGDVPPLEGLDNRYDRAATKLGSTELDVANNLRRGLLKEVGRLIVGRLEKHRAEADTPQKISEPGYAFEDEPPFPLVQALAWKAIELHYSALVALFIYHFAHILPREDSFGRENHYPSAYTVWWACCERLFRCYVEWIATYHMMQYTQTANADSELDMLAEPSRGKLKVLYETCVSYGPASIRELDFESLGELFSDAMNYVKFDNSPLYTEVWLPWYRGEIEYPDPENHRAVEEKAGIEVPEKAQPHNLNIVAAKSFEMFGVVSAEIALVLPFDPMGRDLAYKNIASSYIFDEWTPIYGGKSLRDHAVIFITRTQAALDKL